MIEKSEYKKRIDIVFPTFLKHKKKKGFDTIELFYHFSSDLYTKFDSIQWNSYDSLSKYYISIPYSEQYLYQMNNTLFQKKYVFLGKLECFYEFVSFTDKHFYHLFSINIKKNNVKLINIKNSLFIKYGTFKIEFENSSYYLFDIEKERIIEILKDCLSLIQKLDNRLKQDDLLLYLSIFYKGTAEKINFYGIHPLIYEYIASK